MPHSLWLDRRDDGDITIVHFRLHRLTDDDDTRDVFAMLQQLAEVMGRKKIILELAEVDYFASLAVAKLVMLNRKVESRGGVLVLCRVTERVRNVLRITHLDDILKIADTEDEARTLLVTRSVSEDAP